MDKLSGIRNSKCNVLEFFLEVELKYDIIIDAKGYHEAEIKKQSTPFRVTVLRGDSYYGA